MYTLFEAAIEKTWAIYLTQPPFAYDGTFLKFEKSQRDAWLLNKASSEQKEVEQFIDSQVKNVTPDNPEAANAWQAILQFIINKQDIYRRLNVLRRLPPAPFRRIDLVSSPTIPPLSIEPLYNGLVERRAFILEYMYAEDPKTFSKEKAAWLINLMFPLSLYESNGATAAKWAYDKTRLFYLSMKSDASFDMTRTLFAVTDQTTLLNALGNAKSEANNKSTRLGLILCCKTFRIH